MKTVLQTHDLSVGYRTARRPPVVIASELSLSLTSGRLVCLLGPNGAGKSTLMRTIAGMHPALSGHITVAGDDVQSLTSAQLATRLSIVLTERPDLGLLNGYALVALGRHPYTDWMGRLSRHDEAVIRWAVQAVGATDTAHRPVMELSDGQRQKLMIARALAQESELMLLDEPTAYLDLPRRAEIMHLLRHLAVETGRAILLSTHDLDLALRTADTLWLMADGHIAVGTPEDLVLSGAFEAAFHSEGVMFDRQSGSFLIESAARSSFTLTSDDVHGIAHTWTRRALQRAGYSEQNKDDALLRIDISGDKQHRAWHLSVGGIQSTHCSIADLLTALSVSADEPA